MGYGVATKKLLYKLSLFINIRRDVPFLKFPQSNFMQIALINLRLKDGVISHCLSALTMCKGRKNLRCE